MNKGNKYKVIFKEAYIAGAVNRSICKAYGKPTEGTASGTGWGTTPAKALINAMRNLKRTGNTDLECVWGEIKFYKGSKLIKTVG